MPPDDVLAGDIARLAIMTHEQLLAERAQAEIADATGQEGDDDRTYLAALEKRIAELQTPALRPAPDGVPLYYRVTVPSGGTVCARFAGEGDPVRILMRSRPGKDYTGLEVSRDVAWALWAALSDALMTGVDAVPDWALELIDPTDEDGQPLVDPPIPRWPF